MSDKKIIILGLDNERGYPVFIDRSTEESEISDSLESSDNGPKKSKSAEHRIKQLKAKKKADDEIIRLKEENKSLRRQLIEVNVVSKFLDPWGGGRDCE